MEFPWAGLPAMFLGAALAISDGAGLGYVYASMSLTPSW